MPKPPVRIVLVIGKPGAGKSTLCSKLANEFGLVHLSVGHLFRQLISNIFITPGLDMIDHRDVDVIKQQLGVGGVVPSEITMRVIDNVIRSHINTWFIIDAFPLNLDNIKALAHTQYVDAVEFIMLLDVVDDVCINRVLSREARGDEMVNKIENRLKRYAVDGVQVEECFQKLNMLEIVPGKWSEDEVFHIGCCLLRKYNFNKPSKLIKTIIQLIQDTPESEYNHETKQTELFDFRLSHSRRTRSNRGRRLLADGPIHLLKQLKAMSKEEFENAMIQWSGYINIYPHTENRWFFIPIQLVFKEWDQLSRFVEFDVSVRPECTSIKIITLFHEDGTIRQSDYCDIKIGL